MMTKLRVRISVFSVIAIGVLLLTGCPLEDTTTVSERLNAFMSDVNREDYTSLYTHFHPLSSAFTARRAAETWTPAPFARGETYQLGTISNNATVTTTISGGIWSGDSITFTMLEDGSDNWKIRSITGAFSVQ